MSVETAILLDSAKLALELEDGLYAENPARIHYING